MKGVAPWAVLFDDGCGFCRGWVRFLQARAPEAFRFVPLASEEARALLGAEPPADTLVVVTDRGPLTRSDAVLALARRLPPPWSWAVALKVLPRPLRDLAYRVVARHRHRLCAL